MAGQDPDDHDDDHPTPWYNRTPNVIGASVAGVAVIGIIIAAVTFVAAQSNEPEQPAPLNFVDPSFTATATHDSSTPTTTATITSTSPPVTTDIDLPSSTSSSTSSSSDTSSSSEPSTSTRVTQSRPNHTDDEPGSGTTRRGPHTNVTRTVYPQP